MVLQIVTTGGGQCPNVDSPCHWTQQCDDSVIGGFQCRCDPNDPSLTEMAGACVDSSLWTEVGVNNLGFKAVHLAPQVMTYDDAKEYCKGLGGVLPNYFSREVEQAVRTIPAEQM